MTDTPSDVWKDAHRTAEDCRSGGDVASAEAIESAISNASLAYHGDCDIEAACDNLALEAGDRGFTSDQCDIALDWFRTLTNTLD